MLMQWRMIQGKSRDGVRIVVSVGIVVVVVGIVIIMLITTMTTTMINNSAAQK